MTNRKPPINGIDLGMEKVSPAEARKIQQQQELLDHFIKRVAENSASFAISEERKAHPDVETQAGFQLDQVRRIAAMAATTAIMAYQELVVTA